MKPFALHVAALSLISLIGCADPGVESVAIQRDAIVNGKLSSRNDDAVVGVLGGGSGCTGALIAPTVVLTALHCVAGFDSRFTFSCRSDGTLAPGSTTGQLGATVDPKNVTVSFGVELGAERVHAKAIYSTGSTDVCHDDLAVIVLESAPNVGDVPLVSLRFARPTRRGEIARAVGYGDVEKTQTELGRQERTSIVLRGVGGPDVSNPGDPGIAPRTLQVGEGPCHGDSGGPLFSEETGAEIGVYSILHTSTCTGLAVRNTYTLVAPFESLIREALESEGAEPLVEPDEPDEPTGSGGGAGAASVPVGGASGGPSGTAGEGAAAVDPNDGSGSYRQSGCAVRAAGKEQRAPSTFVLSSLIVAGWVAARRRARVHPGK
jgi:hypothetical protein